MPRESAEEKIARIVRETMAGERRAEEEKSNPQLGKLRQLIREEVGGALGELLNDKGDGGKSSGSRRRTDDQGEDDADSGDLLKAIFGG